MTIQTEALKHQSTLAQSQRPKWALALLFLTDGAGFGTWAAHVAVFKQNLALTNGTLTLVLLCLIGGAILTMPFVGQLIARHGSHRILRVIAVYYFIVIAILGQTHSLPFLLFFAFLFGTAKGAFDVSINSQVFAVEALYHRSYQGLFQGSWAIGGLLGSGIASLLLHAGGTIFIDLTSAAVVLGSCAVVALPMLTADAHQPEKAKGFVRPDASILRVSLIAFFGLLVEGAIADWASVYLHTQVRVSLSLAAIGYASFSVTMAISRFSSDWMMRSFASRQILFMSGLFIAAGMGCTLLFPSWWPSILGFILTGIGVATVVPVTFSIAGRNTRMGTGPAISAIATIGYFGFLAGPPIIGSLAILTGLRAALGVVIFAGLFIAVAPSFFSLDEKNS